MSVKLRYELTGPGWADCTIEIGEARAIATASYLSDALDSLSGAVVALLRDEETATAIFAEEPGEYRWEFSRLGADRVSIRIREIVRRDALGVVIFEADARLRTFAGALVSELQRLLSEHGKDGYKERWVLHDFPERRLLQLQELLQQ